MTQPWRDRPTWWVDAQRRDADADTRDQRRVRSEDLAVARDATAQERDDAAREHDQAAVDRTAHAQARLRTQDEQGVEFEIERVRSDHAVAEAFTWVGTLPGVSQDMVKDAQHSVEMCLDRASVAVLGMYYDREAMRADLREAVQDQGAAGQDRLAAGEDRAASAGDRHAAGVDREHAREARQQALLDRAGDS